MVDNTVRNRRTVLTTTGAALSVGLAGCASGNMIGGATAQADVDFTVEDTEVLTIEPGTLTDVYLQGRGEIDYKNLDGDVAWGTIVVSVVRDGSLERIWDDEFDSRTIDTLEPSEGMYDFGIARARITGVTSYDATDFEPTGDEDTKETEITVRAHINLFAELNPEPPEPDVTATVIDTATVTIRHSDENDNNDENTDGENTTDENGENGTPAMTVGGEFKFVFTTSS